MLKGGIRALKALKLAADEISKWSKDNPARQAEWMIQTILGADRAKLYGDQQLKLNDEQAGRLSEYLKRRASGEPLQYILGTVEFRNLTLKVDRRALIPRPETEGLVEMGLGFIRDITNAKVLDIGTGCGAIALSMIDENPTCQVTAVEISEEALELAKENGKHSNLDSRITWINADLFADSFPGQFNEPFDLIISNPPYVSQRKFWELPGEIRMYEPETALLTGSDGTAAIQRMAEICHKILILGCHFVCEIGDKQDGIVSRIFQNTGWDAYIKRDLSGRQRYLIASRSRISA